MSYFFLFLFGIGIGVVSGLLGIGGGILLVPGLMLLFNLSQPEAQGTSLAVLTPPIGIFAAIIYYQHGYVKLPVAAWVAVGFIVGACLGAKIIELIRPENSELTQRYLRLAFGALLLYTGFVYVFSSSSSEMKRWGAVLPAALSTLLSLVVARILGKTHRQAAVPTPPGDDSEYHI